jgi:thiol-disulfide isomerase/thioredoxin
MSASGGSAVAGAGRRHELHAPLAWTAMAALLLASLLVAVSAPAAELRVGASVPDFRLPDSHGRLSGAAEGQTPVVIIEFWATWCAPCRTLLPALAGLAHRYAPEVRLVAINIDRDRASADRFLEHYLPDSDSTLLLFDSENRLMADWGAPGMPAVYVAVRGVVRLVASGYSQDKLEAIEAVVRESLQRAATPTP